MPNLNTFRILSLIWKRRSISRIVAAAELGLTKSTITKITSQLMDDGLVTEAPGKVEGRGRPRVALSLNQARGLVLGLEIRTDGWASVLVRFDGSVARSDAGNQNWDPKNLAEEWGELIERLAHAPPGGVPILGVGLALPGIVDTRQGILVRSNPLNVQAPITLGDVLERRLGLAVVLENDANCGCWGELAFGSAPVPGPFVFVLCEDRWHRAASPGSHRVAAVGFGLVLGGGRPWRGPDYSAGEFSSVLKGGTAERSSQFDLSDVAMAQVFDQPHAHRHLAEELGRNVGMLVNFLNLRAVYVAWPASGDASEVRSIIRRCIEDNWIYPTPVDCTVSAPSGGGAAVAWGAAGFFLESLWGDRSFEEAPPRWK